MGTDSLQIKRKKVFFENHSQPIAVGAPPQCTTLLQTSKTRHNVK